MIAHAGTCDNVDPQYAWQHGHHHSTYWQLAGVAPARAAEGALRDAGVFPWRGTDERAPRQCSSGHVLGPGLAERTGATRARSAHAEPRTKSLMICVAHINMGEMHEVVA